MKCFEVVFDGANGFKAGDIVSEDRLQNANVKYLLKVGAIKASTEQEESIAKDVDIRELALETADLRSQVAELTADKVALEADLKKAADEVATLKKPK